jgi:competence ComEA-like helix-hairpin-helix protein
MKKLAIFIFVFFFFISLGIYFSKDYKYRDYAIEKKSDERKSYRVNLNLGEWEDFDTLPGIGPQLAKEIVNDRNVNGRFTSKEDIKRVKGIGQKKYDLISEYLGLSSNNS